MARLTFPIRAWFGAAAAALLVAACSAPASQPSSGSPGGSTSASTTLLRGLRQRPRRCPRRTRRSRTWRGVIPAPAAARRRSCVPTSLRSTPPPDRKVGDLALYSTPGCSRCGDWLAEFGLGNEASGLHSQAPFVSLRSAEVASLRGSVAIVVTHLVVPQAKVVNASGSSRSYAQRGGQCHLRGEADLRWILAGCRDRGASVTPRDGTATA